MILSPSGPRTEGPDEDGFYTTYFEGPSFNGTFGEIRSRVEGSVARVRIATGPGRANPLGALHGGFLLGFLDQAVFVGPATLGRLVMPNWAVTLNFATQFMAPGRADLPLDCVIEVVSETGKLLFLRGQMEQERQALLTFQATLRKIRLGG
ncbi:PaaI family thioesterase [Sphingomonas sp. CGMCC 1.13654]|uniref:PaaI family thioesterase n=1 Tax=Sphingomonas chungangi TaxID=2683589 RepID=A0A838LCM7_9SPHN|nr:PaaI family thioesterase [Sphingomonas chungangi]MBA2936632.1 PaaI family thioesterase [Sphingomonas chungangi]